MSADKQVPFHMREDSDSEIEEEAAKEMQLEANNDQPTPEVGSSKGKKKEEEKSGAGGLKQLFGRKPKVGKIEVDPNIGMSSLSPKSWS